MKLIIDIPDDYYEIIKHDVDNHLTHYRPFVIIGNGIPLDDVKAEIEQEYNRLRATRADETLELGECLGLKMSLKILNNIGKGDK